MKTKEEQLAFAIENQRLVDEMGKIIESGPSEENIILMNQNIKDQRKLWDDYNKKYTEEVK